MKKITGEFEESAKALQSAARNQKKEKFLLRLYVTGSTPYSAQAVTNIKKICEEHLKGRYDLVVIDLYKNPELAREEQIIAAPTLIKKLPLPLRRIIGSMSSAEKVLIGLDLLHVPNNGNNDPSL
jgi:circadian clock protein KaiB